MRAREKSAGLTRDHLQPGLERMVVRVRDVEREDRRARGDERIARFLVAMLHGHAGPSEPAKAVADKHYRLRARQAAHGIGDAVKGLLYRVRLGRRNRIETADE